MRNPPRLARWLLLLPFLTGLALAAETSRGLEDFEGDFRAERWTFSNGAEFPGAKGSFQRSRDAAHRGEYGGELAFDFSGGGNYVSASVRLPTDETGGSTPWAGLQLWLQRPEGHAVMLRYHDAAGQTFQRPVECAAGNWVRVTVPFSDWTAHWGGANDGQVRGQPRSLSLILDRGAQTNGTLRFDDLRLVDETAAIARVSYPAFRFAPSEGWRTSADGSGGATRLDGRSWTADFAQGARAISLSLPDQVLLGRVDRLRLRVRGTAPGQPVTLVMHTHFMTFQKVIGEFNGDGEQELVTAGPPGPGWTWHGGENDGKLHGPLRLGKIILGRGTNAVRRTLEWQEIAVEASCPPEQRCVLLAESRGGTNEAAFVVRARALSETPMTGRLQWVWRDWDGAELGRGEQAVTVPARTEPMELTLPIPASARAGRKFLGGEFHLDLPDQAVPPVEAAWVAGITEAGDATLEPESPFGMGVYLNRYGGDAAGLAQMERAARMAQAVGVKWSREDFSWSRIERQRGEFDWTYYDQLVACARRHGITVYAIVGYWTSWTKPYTAEGIADYVRFVRALVQRYHHEIKQWEIWNEPNIFFWDGPKDLYADLLKQSYAAIKELDPAAQVLGLSTAGIDRKYISRMLELKAPFDILTIHPYRPHLNDLGFIDDLKEVAEQVRLPDGQRRPVWLTEMGWATHTPHNVLRQDFAATTLRAQAELLARSYLCSIVSGVEPRTFWYNFRNDGQDPIYFEHQMGIIYQDFTPKPAYLAYATLTRMLRGQRLAGPVPAPPGVLAFRFRPTDGGPGETLAVWSPAADAALSLPTTAKQARRVNTLGEESSLPSAEGQVKLQLQRGAPVYLRFP